MKKISVFLMIFLCTIFVSTYAEPIKYNVSGGLDTEGYSLSGYVYLDDQMHGTGEPGGSLSYSIGEFQISSNAGSAYGDSGILFFFVYPIGQEYPYDQVCVSSGIADFDLDYSGNIVGKQNYDAWNNGQNGVVFYDDGIPLSMREDYFVLPEEIRILSLPYVSYNGYWGPNGDTLILSKSAQPVPEPSSILLLGASIVGLAGLRRKLRS